MAYDYSKLTYDQLIEIARKSDPNFGKYYDPYPKDIGYGSDEFYSTRQENTPKNFYSTDLSSIGLGRGQYLSDGGNGQWTLDPNEGDDHNVQLTRGANGEIIPKLLEADRGWVANHTKEIAGALALMGGGAALFGAGAGGGAAAAGGGLGGGTSIAALTPEAAWAGGLGASNTAIAGMGGAAGIGAAGGGLAVAGGGMSGGLLGTGISDAAAAEAVQNGLLVGSNTLADGTVAGSFADGAVIGSTTAGETLTAGMSTGGLAGAIAGDAAASSSTGLLNADPYANETAKLSAQNAAPAGTLNPTNLPSVNTTSPDYLDYANKGMKAYNTISGMAGGQQSGGGMANGTTTNQIDPRMAKYIYGDATNTGILDYAKKMYEANPQGMNAQMVQGMNNQWNTISDPRVKQGFDQIQNTGMGLLSMPIAGNPFTNGMGGKAQAAQTQQAPQFNPSSYQGLLAGGDAQGAGQNPFSLMQAGASMIPNGVPYMGGNSQNIDKIKRG